MTNYYTSVCFNFFIFLIFTGINVNNIAYAQQQTRSGPIQTTASVDFMVVDWNTALITSASMKATIFCYVYDYKSSLQTCKKVEQNVFTDSEIISALKEKYITLSVDLNSTLGRKLLKDAKVVIRSDKYPAYLFLSQYGELLLQESGYKSVSDFKKLLKRVEETPTTEEIEEGNIVPVNYEFDLYKSLYRQYQEGNRAPDFLKKCIWSLKSFQNLYPDLINDYLSVIPAKEYSTDENSQIILEFADQYNTKAYHALLADKKTFVDKFGNEKVNNVLKNAIRGAVLPASRAKTGGLFMLNNLMGSLRTLGLSDVEIFEFEMRSLFFTQTGKWEDYSNVAVSFMKKDLPLPASDLEDLTWNFVYHVSDKIKLEQAVKYYKKSVSKTPPTYSSCETFAALLYKSGSKRKAMKEITEAIQIAKNKRMNYGSALRVEGYIRSKKPIPIGFKELEF
ncbi:MAG: hypothetical protein IPM47_01940 [Sphingobacteriales bacterium]|nr:MAG: hypothetical protein IPM47_01940 [Sphingobacteriales bacterium]